MTEEAYDILEDLNWIEMRDYSYIVKYKFHKDGYALTISDLGAVYGEIVNVEAIQERFQILNPFAEMLPKVILKHVKQLAKNTFTNDQSHEQTERKISLHAAKFLIQNEYKNSGARFKYIFEPQLLTETQFRNLIIRPTLLKILILGEEKAALQRRNEELEGRQSSSSSHSSNKGRNIKDIYSEIQKSSASGSSIISAFLYVQNDKVTLPKSLGGTTSDSRMSYQTQNKMQFPKKLRISIKKERNEDESNLNNERIKFECDESTTDHIVIKEEKIEDESNTTVTINMEKNEDEESNMNVPIKMEKYEDESNMKYLDISSAKAHNPKQLNNRVSLTSTEVAIKNSKSKNIQTSYLESSPSKKIKKIKF